MGSPPLFQGVTSTQVYVSQCVSIEGLYESVTNLGEGLFSCEKCVQSVVKEELEKSSVYQ